MKSLAIIVLALMPLLAVAQGTSTGEPSLKFLFPARFLSMAGSPLADPNHTSASFANPACLATGKSLEIMFSEMQWIQDIQTQLLSTFIPLPMGSAAFSISNTSISDIPIRETPGPAIGSFDSHSTSFQLGYGLEILPDFGVGATAKYLYDKLYVDEASGYALDLGALYQTPIEGITIGASLTNLGHLSAFRSQETDLPTQVDIGADYAISASGFDFVGAVTLGRETVSNGTSEVRIGGEATYDKLLSVRLGYQTGYEIRGLCMGLGIRYSVVQLDYAYIPFSEGFGDANILTIGVTI